MNQNHTDRNKNLFVGVVVVFSVTCKFDFVNSAHMNSVELQEI